MVGHEGQRGSPRRSGRAAARLRLAALAASTALVTAGPAAAETLHDAVGGHEVVFVSAMLGVIGVALASMIGFIRERDRARALAARLGQDVSDLRARIDGAEALIDAPDLCTVAWGAPGEAPVVHGRLPPGSGVPGSKAGVVAFGSWLAPASASALDAAVSTLRRAGESFQLTLQTTGGGHVEAVGRVAGGHAAVRFRDLTGERAEHADLAERHRRLKSDVEAMRALLEAAPIAAWVRDAEGRLVWVNSTYAEAVEARSPAAATEAGLELLDRSAAKAVEAVRDAEGVAEARLPVVVAGDRRPFDVVEVRSTSGTAGLALDAGEVERLKTELRLSAEFHARTLDQIETAVAIFGKDKRLAAYNPAYRALFGLETPFLETRPTDGDVLEELRRRRRLPEQADWKAFKATRLAVYQTVGEPAPEIWHLPDGQTLRVIASPHPQGGVTYIYENMTEKLELEKRFNALNRVQGETIDHISEGVVVFGSDGRARLANPAFARLWRLDARLFDDKPHVQEVVSWCRDVHDDEAVWKSFKTAITAVSDARRRLTGRMDRRDGTILEFATLPLPDGGTMATFVDITASVNVEKALMEKNEALLEADRVKTDFVGLVSYELRSPLNVIIGFTHLLADAKFGELNEKQLEYAQYIMSSSEQLKTIIDDILDMASIDAGTIKLDLEPTDLADAAVLVTDALKDRMAEARVKVVVEIDEAARRLVADPGRLRQILFNLVSNAVRFSREGDLVHLTARRDADTVEIVVADRGQGIPEEQLEKVFERFYARTQGARRGGTGLGLALTKSFVDLHGGTIGLRSRMGEGTTVTVRLPIAGRADDAAPAEADPRAAHA